MELTAVDLNVKFKTEHSSNPSNVSGFQITFQGRASIRNSIESISTALIKTL